MRKAAPSPTPEERTRCLTPARRRSRAPPTACSSTRASASTDAAALAPYLARLGVSHVYASPYLKARPGSTHGYDIVDHDALNPELGDEAAFRADGAALARERARPDPGFRAEPHGRRRRRQSAGGWTCWNGGRIPTHAGWFDIDWDPDRRYLRDKLLVPFLGDQYGAVLEAGKLVLRFDARGRAASRSGPTTRTSCRSARCTTQRILGDAHPELERLGDAFAGLPDWRPQVGAARQGLQGRAGRAWRASSADVREAIEAAVGRLNGEPGDLGAGAALDALIQDQHWRAAHFRVAADDINYRRFFNINELAGLRMELPELFEHAHRWCSSCCDDGVLDGLRIDHVDGLLDPKGYLRAAARAGAAAVLSRGREDPGAARERCARTGRSRAPPATNSPIWCSALLVDPAGEDGFTQAYADFTGERRRVRARSSATARSASWRTRWRAS